MQKLSLATSLFALSVSTAVAGPMLDEFAASIEADVAFGTEEVSATAESYTAVVLTPREAGSAAIEINNLTILEADGVRTYEAQGVVSTQDGTTVELASVTASGSPESINELALAQADDASEDTPADVCGVFAIPTTLEVAGVKVVAPTQIELALDALSLSSQLSAPDTCIANVVVSLAGLNAAEPAGLNFKTESLEIIAEVPLDSQLPTTETGMALGGAVTVTNLAVASGGADLASVEFLQLYLEQDADSSINLATAGYNSLLSAISAADAMTTGSFDAAPPTDVNVGAMWNASMEVFGSASVAFKKLAVSPEAQAMFMGMSVLPPTPSSMILAAYKDGPSVIAVGSFENEQLGKLYLDFGLAMTAVEEDQLVGASSDQLFALMPFGFTQLQAYFEDRGIGALAALAGFDPYFMAEQSSTDMLGPDKGKLVRAWLEKAQKDHAAISVGSEEPLSIEQTLFAAMGDWGNLPASVSVEMDFQPSTIDELISGE